MLKDKNFRELYVLFTVANLVPEEYEFYRDTRTSYVYSFIYNSS